MQLIATSTDVKHWPALIQRVFRHDVELLRRYHVAAPCELSLAVADTYRALRRYTAPDFVLYALHEAGQGRAVGMAGVEPSTNCVVTFGLSVAARTPERVGQLGQILCNLLDRHQPIRCLLYERNKPAQRFLRRLGFVASPERFLHPETNQPGFLFTLTPH